MSDGVRCSVVISLIASSRDQHLVLPRYTSILETEITYFKGKRFIRGSLSNDTRMTRNFLPVFSFTFNNVTDSLKFDSDCACRYYDI